VNLKALGIVSLVMILGGFLTVNYGPFSSPSAKTPCKEPLTYRLGDIDSRFDITKDQLTKVMKEVETLWGTALDRQLLDYKKDGKVAIHLIYSEDQKRTEAEQALAKRIQNQKKYIKVLENEYKDLKSRFEAKHNEYQKMTTTYNKKAKAYYQLKSKWKGKGITSQLYSRLEKIEKEVKDLRSEIQRKEENLELLRQQTNAKSRQLNTLIDQQNELVTRYNRRFGEAKKFNQGRYIKNGDEERINIFQFSNLAQLKVVLAHEAGHALGLDHVENPKSIMHSIMEKQDIFNLSLTDEDVEAIKDRCNN